jgi:hypothetical protein
MPIFLAAPTPTFSVRETTFKVLASLSFHSSIAWYSSSVKQDKVNLFTWRNRVVFKFLLLKSFYLARRLFFWRAVFRKIKIFLRGN